MAIDKKTVDYVAHLSRIDLKTEELIWSAQYETAVEGSIDDMIDKFVKAAVKDLKGKKII